MKGKHHNFWFSLNTASAKPLEEVSIYIFYKYGNSNLKKKRIPSIKVPFSFWDRKKRVIKSSAVDKKIIALEDLEYLDIIKAKFNSASRKLLEGKLTVDNAFKFLLNANEDDTIINHLVTETPGKYSPDTLLKYKDYLRAVEKHYFGKDNEGKPKNQLKLSNIQDLDSVKDIATKLKSVSSVSSNTVCDYLDMLDVITVRANLNVSKPFKSGKLLPVRATPPEKQVTYVELIEGINKIETKQDYLSYAFWLFSFCLRGLDGTDIVNISEKNVQGDPTLPYYPDWDSDYCFISCNEKAYYLKRRGKSNKYFRILLNLYPTYYLHRLIKQLVKETHPEYSYSGNDRLRLFNFLTKNDKNETVPKGKAKWVALRDTLSKKAKKMVGEGIKTTRHTFTNLAKNELTLTDSEQQDLLQHSTNKKALTHYQSELQMNTDLNHIFSLQEYEIARTVQLLLDYGENKGFHSFKINSGAKTLLMRNNLTTFTIEEEREYQKLLRAFDNKPEPKFNAETGMIEFESKSKPGRLVELENKRKKDYKNTEHLLHVDVLMEGPEGSETNYMLMQRETIGADIWSKKYSALQIQKV